MKLVVVGLVVSSFVAVGCIPSQQQFEPDFGEPDFFDGGVPFVGPQPSFGPTVTATTPPPPLSGGTMVVLAGGKGAVAADPDRDLVYVVDLAPINKLRATVALSAGDEPGRAVEDAAGHVHVVARRGGVVVTIDPATGLIVERKAVCPAPRGIAYEASGDRVHVACAGGELVTLPAGGGDAVRTLRLDRDLRDVVVDNGRLLVSTFRTAQILVVDGNGNLVTRTTLPGAFDFKGPFSPSVAWRMQAMPDGRVGIVHQLGLVGPVETTHGGYGGQPGGCGGIVQSAFGVVDGTTLSAFSMSLASVVLPVDFAVAPDRTTVAVLSTGNAHTPGLTTVSLLSAPAVFVPPPPDMAPSGPPDMGGGCVFPAGTTVTGEPIALGFDAGGDLWVQTREPATLQRVISGGLVDVTITLSTDSRADTGWAVFHSNSGASIACASCHPEGGEDARTWEFDGLGPRRTQTLRGHVGGTEPFHWRGDLTSFDSLVGEVYLKRMAGPLLAVDQKTALFGWVNTIPTLPQSAPVDAAAVARGKALFEDTAHTACSTCHSGPELTNNQTVDVGTGGGFQVPRLLGVGWRAPFLHDGCAATLTDRFGACGGRDQHGVTSQLTAAQVSDLVAYLETL